MSTLSKPQKSGVSLLGRLLIILKTFSVLTESITFAITSLIFKSHKSQYSYFKNFKFGVTRKMLNRMSTREMQYMGKTTEEVYQEYCKKVSAPIQTSELADGTRSHWFGDQLAKNVVIYFHGGGYIATANPAQVQLMHEWSKASKAAGNDTAFVLLGYDIAPEAPYPRQLTQGVALVQHLLDFGKKPENIALIGDSAGGNLALGVLSHVSHPHPSIPPLTLSAPFKSCMLVSPWVKFSSDAPSMKSNANTDCFYASTIEYWGADFMGGTPWDNYSVPLLADSKWWEGVKCDEFLCILGNEELLRDDILAWAETFKAAGVHIEVDNKIGEAHDQMLMDLMLGEPRSVSSKDIEKWAARM